MMIMTLTGAFTPKPFQTVQSAAGLETLKPAASVCNLMRILPPYYVHLLHSSM